MNMTNTKLLISVSKNLKLFSKNITTYRDIPLQNLPPFVHFPPQKFRSRDWEPSNLVHIHFLSLPMLCPNCDFPRSAFFVKSKRKKFRLKNRRFFSVLGSPNHYHVIFDPQNWHAWCFVNLQCCVQILAFHILPFLTYHKIKKFWCSFIKMVEGKHRNYTCAQSLN